MFGEIYPDFASECRIVIADGRIEEARRLILDADEPWNVLDAHLRVSLCHLLIQPSETHLEPNSAVEIINRVMSMMSAEGTFHELDIANDDEMYRKTTDILKWIDEHLPEEFPISDE